MSGFFKSSVGQKFLMSITGLFLIVFLVVHLTANLFLLGGSDSFNIAYRTLWEPIRLFK